MFHYHSFLLVREPSNILLYRLAILKRVSHTLMSNALLLTLESLSDRVISVSSDHVLGKTPYILVVSVSIFLNFLYVECHATVPSEGSAPTEQRARKAMYNCIPPTQYRCERPDYQSDSSGRFRPHIPRLEASVLGPLSVSGLPVHEMRRLC